MFLSLDKAISLPVEIEVSVDDNAPLNTGLLVKPFTF